MKKIQHFVITRFNLKKTGGFTTDKNGVKTLSDEWLLHRFDLFERYCLPSLAGQKDKDFVWLLFFDQATPDVFRERISSAQEICPQLKVLYIEGDDVKPYVRNFADEDTDVLITTRIDNDDAFRDDALAVIKSYARDAKEDLVINMRFGYSFNGDEAEVFSQKYNPFSSLIEMRKPSGFKTILGAGHGKIHHLAKVVQIKSGPHWMMVVHERNVANRMPEEYRYYSLWKWRRLRRYVKKYLLHKLRRMFWPSDFKKKYKIDELVNRFHVKSG